MLRFLKLGSVIIVSFCHRNVLKYGRSIFFLLDFIHILCLFFFYVTEFCVFYIYFVDYIKEASYSIS